MCTLCACIVHLTQHYIYYMHIYNLATFRQCWQTLTTHCTHVRSYSSLKYFGRRSMKVACDRKLKLLWWFWQSFRCHFHVSCAHTIHAFLTRRQYRRLWQFRNFWWRHTLELLWNMILVVCSGVRVRSTERTRFRHCTEENYHLIYARSSPLLWMEMTP